MNALIDITGYSDSYENLVTKVAMPGEFYNVLDGTPFTTYVKTDETEIGYQGKETDVLGWYQVKAELESNVVKPNDGDVYITGLSSPYTRWKATVRGIDIKWDEDGEEELKIVKNYKDLTRLGRAKLTPEEGIYYSLGKVAPYKLYGVISAWDPVGTFISYTAKSMKSLEQFGKGSGEVGLVNGLFYIHTSEGWKQITIPEPIADYSKHTYVDRMGNICKIREGFALGTLEFYSPKE